MAGRIESGKGPEFPRDQGKAISDKLKASKAHVAEVAKSTHLHAFSAKKGGFSTQLPPTHEKIAELGKKLFNQT